MADITELKRRLVQADMDGDQEAVQVLSEMIRRQGSPQAKGGYEAIPQGGGDPRIEAGIPGADLNAWRRMPVNERIAFLQKYDAQNLANTPSSSERRINNALAGAAAVPIMAGGVRGAQLLFKGSKASPYVTQLGRATIPTTGTQLAREGIIGAGAGVAAGEAGDWAVERYGENARPVGELFGGAAGGFAGNAAINSIRVPVDVTRGLFGTLKEKFLGAELPNAIGTTNANTLINRALTSNPNLVDDLRSAAKIQERTGVNLPMSAAAKDDPSVKSMMAKVTSRQENDTFVAEMVNAENAAKQQLSEARKKLALNPKDASAIAEHNAAKDNAKQAAERLVVARKEAKRQQIISNIDERIGELSDTLYNASQDKTKVGDSLKNLVSAREQAVKAEFTPIYKQIVEEGQATGATMPSESVSAIKALVDEYGEKNIFQAAPELSKIIKRVLGSRPTQATAVGKGKVSSRITQTAEDTGLKTLNAEQTDSLKRAINDAIRSNQNTSHSNFLKALKEEFNKGLDGMGEFGAKLKETDKQYRMKIGEPFLDANGVVAVNDAKFAERTIPLLLNGSSLRDIKAAVGDEPGFNQLVRDAWLFKIGGTSSIVKDGSINPQALDRLIRNNKSAIEQIPGLESELRAVGGRVDALQAVRQRILNRQRESGLQAFEERAKSNPTLWQEISSTNGGLIGYVEKALKTPDDMSKLIQQAGTSQESHAALRSAALEAAFKKGDKLDFFDTHKEAFDNLFGKGYSEDVKLLLDAAQRLEKHPFFFRPNPALSSGTGFQQQFGISPVQAGNTIRQNFTSVFHKASVFLSKFVTNKAQQTEQDEIMNFLRNRKAVGDAAEAMRIVEEELKNAGTLGKRGLDYMKKLAGNSITSAIFGGAAGVALGEAGMLEQAPKRQYVEPEANMEIQP